MVILTTPLVQNATFCQIIKTTTYVVASIHLHPNESYNRYTADNVAWQNIQPPALRYKYKPK